MFLNKVIDPLAQLIGEWITELNIGTILIRLVLAVLCAGVIGVERAKKRHAAGFRTYILVCLGAAIAMLTNQFIFETYASSIISRPKNEVQAYSKISQIRAMDRLKQIEKIKQPQKVLGLSALPKNFSAKENPRQAKITPDNPCNNVSKKGRVV